MADVPDDPPPACPVCDCEFDSVTVHREGVMVNLLENRRYHRVCFDPRTRGGDGCLYFYHHTHEQVPAAGPAVEG